VTHLEAGRVFETLTATLRRTEGWLRDKADRLTLLEAREAALVAAEADLELDGLDLDSSGA
jgi:hypothetical protein